MQINWMCALNNQCAGNKRFLWVSSKRTVRIDAFANTLVELNQPCKCKSKLFASGQMQTTVAITCGILMKRARFVDNVTADWALSSSLPIGSLFQFLFAIGRNTKFILFRFHFSHSLIFDEATLELSCSQKINIQSKISAFHFRWIKVLLAGQEKSQGNMKRWSSTAGFGFYLHRVSHFVPLKKFQIQCWKLVCQVETKKCVILPLLAWSETYKSKSKSKFWNKNCLWIAGQWNFSQYKCDCSELINLQSINLELAPAHLSNWKQNAITDFSFVCAK